MTCIHGVSGPCEQCSYYFQQGHAQQQGLANQAMQGMLGQQQDQGLPGAYGVENLLARITELEASLAATLPAIARIVELDKEIARLKDRESGVARLADVNGQLRSDNDRLTLENARLRRKLGL